MIPPLYEHQKKIIKENKLKCGLFLGTGEKKIKFKVKDVKKWVGSKGTC